MTAEGHLLFAVASAIFAKKAELSPALAAGDWWHIIPAAMLTALLPDIDHPKSILGQRLKWISVPIARLCGHRGFTHSLLAILLGVYVIRTRLPLDWPLPGDVYHAMIVGYLSHIIADMLTTAGVPLLWPCRWRFRLPILNSDKGNQLERILCVGLILFMLWQPQQPLESWHYGEPVRWLQQFGQQLHELLIR
ncbi:metal-dependent hydrolase [Dickeya oryzae]|uniref:metal-dependent hydrolase n=1 Tax=Dickeya oryzae TaxID=1240404 RepID=UPI001AECF11D|nr:metal-dependent hydrolase [Dickeya oryzae]MBP2847111.1 metal-dependent hydrolase [Dickeya oryzae]